VINIIGASTNEEYAKKDAAGDVVAGRGERVLIVKVVAVATRSARLEE
jgi:hypothetical protein